jgi:hypothetical protein
LAGDIELPDIELPASESSPAAVPDRSPAGRTLDDLRLGTATGCGAGTAAGSWSGPGSENEIGSGSGSELGCRSSSFAIGD